jgi:hypothetical protein
MKGLLHEDLHRLIDMTSKKIKNSGCRDGAGGESTGYFARGLEFNSQHLHGGSWSSVAPVPRGSDALFWKSSHKQVIPLGSFLGSLQEPSNGLSYFLLLPPGCV